MKSFRFIKEDSYYVTDKINSPYNEFFIIM